MSEAVLDASVVLAAVLGEAGGEAVGTLPSAGLVSAVNYAEVLTRLDDLGVAADAAEASISLLGLEVVDFDAAQARHAAGLRAATRSSGLSLGDRACLALALSRKASAFTADRAWTEASVPVEIRLIR